MYADGMLGIEDGVFVLMTGILELGGVIQEELPT